MVGFQVVGGSRGSDCRFLPSFLVSFFLFFFFFFFLPLSPTTPCRSFIFMFPRAFHSFLSLLFEFVSFLRRSSNGGVSLQGHARPMAGGPPHRFANQDIFNSPTFVPTNCGQPTVF
jgi:hypothetical protein